MLLLIVSGIWAMRRARGLCENGSAFQDLPIVVRCPKAHINVVLEAAALGVVLRSRGNTCWALERMMHFSLRACCDSYCL